MRRFSPVWDDVKRGRNVDAYVAVAISTVLAVLGVAGDLAPDGVKWGALFAGLAILVYRVAVPPRPEKHIEQILADRTAFVPRPLAELLDNAQRLWVFAPSAVNLLSEENCDLIRRTVLSRTDGSVRIVVIDPTREAAVILAGRQLDDTLRYGSQDFRTSLDLRIGRLRRMHAWATPGTIEYRHLDFNPGFSLVVVDGGLDSARVIVEFHGFRNEATTFRMHAELTRRDSEKWVSYWLAQFEGIWDKAVPPIR